VVHAGGKNGLTRSVEPVPWAGLALQKGAAIVSCIVVDSGVGWPGMRSSIVGLKLLADQGVGPHQLNHCNNTVVR